MQVGMAGYDACIGLLAAQENNSICVSLRGASSNAPWLSLDPLLKLSLFFVAYCGWTKSCSYKKEAVQALLGPPVERL